jgi:hypothetical protein
MRRAETYRKNSLGHESLNAQPVLSVYEDATAESPRFNQKVTELKIAPI